MYMWEWEWHLPCDDGNGILPFVKSQIDVKHVQYCHQR